LSSEPQNHLIAHYLPEIGRGIVDLQALSLSFHTCISAQESMVKLCVILCVSLFAPFIQGRVTAARPAVPGPEDSTNPFSPENLSPQEWSAGLAKLFSQSFLTDDDERNRQEKPAPACNDILDEYSKEDAKQIVGRILDGLNLDQVIKQIILAQIKYGVQVRKICAACTDFEPISGFCTESDYGSDVTHSGLTLIPLEESGTSILAGTLIPAIYCHGTRTDSQPSTEWAGSETSVGEVMLNLMITVTQGTAGLLPDYMGYGESLGKAFRGYIVKKSYQTSTIPLVKKISKLFEEETGCTTALADAAVVMGYSEGGYAAVAVAEALKSMDIDIIQVEAGAGPYSISSVQIYYIVKNIDDGTFTLPKRFYLALFGSAYSSTYEDLSNYELQNILSAEYRDKIVGLVNTGASEATLNNNIPISNPLVIMNEAMVKFIRSAIAAGEIDPCSPFASPIPGRSEVLDICKALVEQDLRAALESVEYPVRFCHSTDDVLVDYRNIPNVTKNPMYLTVNLKKGPHYEAGAECLTDSFLFFLLGSTLSQYPVEEKLCEAPSQAPSTSASQSPTEAPTREMDDFVRIASSNYNGCIELRDLIAKDIATLVLGPCNSNALWKYDFETGLFHTYQDESKCMQAGLGGNIEEGSKIRVAPCDVTSKVQVFDWDIPTNKRIFLKSRPDLCVVFQGVRANVNADNIILHDCNHSGGVNGDRTPWNLTAFLN
jgi:hypothetical protein